MTHEALLAGALALPRDVRADFVRDVVASLDGPAAPESEAKWAAEVTRRLELYRAGKLEVETMDDAIATLRREFAERRD